MVKISDFGLTRDIYDSRIYECSDLSEKRLPWKWLAPECMHQGTFTHKSDVVSETLFRVFDTVKKWLHIWLNYLNHITIIQGVDLRTIRR